MEHFELRLVRGGYPIDERTEKSLPHFEIEKVNCIVLRAHFIEAPCSKLQGIFEM